MNAYRKLMVIVAAGALRSPALMVAIDLARRGASELLIRVASEHGSLADEGADEARSWLAATMTQLRQDGITVTGSVVSGSPAMDAIIADIIQAEPDLVIKELHHESALRRLFVTPDDWTLARRSPAPLLGVAPDATGLPLSIVAAVDINEADPLGHLNDRILGEARRFADAAGAELHLAHVYEPVVDIPEDPSMMLAAAPPVLMDELRQIHQQRFSEIAGAHGVPASRQHLVIGRVDSSLEELCEKIGARLIVAGSTYPQGLERFVSGSTSEDLLAHARQSVLVVKPEIHEPAVA